MTEPTLKVERVFNLGDYKSFRSVAAESELPHDERVMIMVDNVADSYEQFIIHQIMQDELYGKDASKWYSRLELVNELREKYKQGLLVGTTEEGE